MSAVTRTGGALSWLANAPLSLLRRGLAASGSSAGLLASPLNSLRRSAGLAGNALKALAGAPLAVLRGGMSGIRNIIAMVMNPLAALRGDYPQPVACCVFWRPARWPSFALR